MDAVKETLKAVQSREQGGAPIKELTELLEIECKARKNDVDELRHQLQLTESLVSGAASAPVHQSLEDLDLRMTRLVSALETERDHRRSDSERHHAALSDVMDSLKAERSLRGNEVEKMRSALAQLAMNLQQASESSEPSRWVDAFASLQSALDADRSERPAPQARGGSQTVRVRMQARMEPLTSKSERGKEVAELANQLHQIHQQVLAQDSSNMTVAAKLRGEVAAKSAECRGDVAALRSEMLKKMDGASPTRRDGLAPGGRRIERWRWAASGYVYPPYQFREEFLLWRDQKWLRAAVERGAGWADDRDGQVGADHRAKHRALGGEAL
ncbi:Hypothetical protein (Fragment) [Durusdinium trenchii]|uniref:Uncharacterized protein n=1 Tax=Durusdinium trenchii TaxID=1381693 RepID=A0ABP0PZ77_9DINO